MLSLEGFLIVISDCQISCFMMDKKANEFASILADSVGILVLDLYRFHYHEKTKNKNKNREHNSIGCV